MVNKKILGLILLSSLVILSSPILVSAASSSASPLGLKEMAGKIETVAVDIATPIVVIGWIIAGILYLTAAGNPEKIGIAKKALMACVIGTVVVVLAIGTDIIINIIKDALGIPVE